MKVLDLDMDYFMNEIANTPFACKERLDEEYYGNSVWDEKEVRQFLEQNYNSSWNFGAFSKSQNSRKNCK